MAKRKLNKKAALVGSIVFVCLVLAAIGLVLYLNRDPHKFIRDGDAWVQSARKIEDEDAKTEEWAKAEASYGKALGFAKTDSLRQSLLFKLADMYVETDQWPKVLGAWKRIIGLDPKNVKARFGQLKYFYIMADSGARQQWQEVASRATELLEIAEQGQLLMEDTAGWDPFETQEKAPQRHRLGPYLYMVRGRAVLHTTRMGTHLDPEKSIAQAIADLKKVQELEPNNVSAFLYLAQAITVRGETLASIGKLEERDKAAQQAKELLQRAADVAGSDPQAHINLLSAKLSLARRGQPRLTDEQVQSFQQEYLSLVEEFPSSGKAFSALAGFYRRRTRTLEKAITAAEKAVELDRENFGYTADAAYLHYRKSAIYGEEPELYKAIEAAKRALTLPDAQDKPGPRQWANRMNRVLLYDFLAECYLGRLIESDDVIPETLRQEWLTKAEQVVHETEQLFGIGQAPQVIKWQGMLQFAKGDRSAAIKKLYTAYQQLKAAKPSVPPLPRDPQYAWLCYVLARIFQDTTEVGAASEFLVNALYSGIAETRPQALLEHAEILLKLRLWSEVLSDIDLYEENFWSNEQSQLLRVRALIGANQFDDAEKKLTDRPPDDPDTIGLKLQLVRAKRRQLQKAIAQRQVEESLPAALDKLESPETDTVPSETSLQLMESELKSYSADMAMLVDKLLQIEPNSVGADSVIAVCNNYITEGKAGEAHTLIDRFLKHFPDQTTAMFYKQLLSEPVPAKISEMRRREIEKQVLSNIRDPIEKAIYIGKFHHGYNEFKEATAEFRKALEIEPLHQAVVQEPTSEQARKQADFRRLAANYLFEIALATKNWELADEIAEKARKENLDDCQGKFFDARLSTTKKQYQAALGSLDECLKEKPVFSVGYMLRSRVNAFLGNEHSAVEDAKKAASLNPRDRTIAKGLAFLLYRRNQRLGDNISSEQVIEAEAALRNAVALNPNDFELRSLYAEYISVKEPLRALAIRQHLQRVAPSVKNALLLGRMALRMALDEQNAQTKDAWFEIAASAFEQGRTLDPQNSSVLQALAEFHRLAGQVEKAEKLLLESGDKRLLWDHYLRSGRIEDANLVLEQLYENEPNDASVIRGLLLVAEKAADRQAVKKYSQLLLALGDSQDNRLVQIQTFLKVGLVKEAEYKLQGFKERFPSEPRALLLEAWLAMGQGQFQRALELVNQSLGAHQDNPLAWRLRGQVNFFMSKYEQAIDDLKKSKALSSDPATQLVLAKAYLEAGRTQDAITELRTAIDRQYASSGGASLGQDPRELLESIYLRLGDREALKDLYDETLKKSPDSVYWNNQAGASALAQGEFDRAERFYEFALQKSSKQSKDKATALDGYLQALILGAGSPNTASGGWHPEKLGKVFEEAAHYVDTDLAPIAYLRMAQAKMKLADKTTAVEYAREARTRAFQGGEGGFALKILRGVYSTLGAEEVLTYCEKRLETDPNSLAANLTIFSLMTIDGRYNKALIHIDKVLETIGPSDPRRLDYVIRKVRVLQLAHAKTSDNKYLDKAVTEYESLLAKMPKNEVVLNNLAYVLAKRDQRLAQALEYAKQALEKRPNNPGFLDTYAYVMHKNGRSSDAYEFMQAALQQYELNRIRVPAEVYENLGMIRETLGDYSLAAAAYRKALQAGQAELSQLAAERINSAIERLSKKDTNAQ
jgi:tetratricopeptide (TPR) repeat protein